MPPEITQEELDALKAAQTKAQELETANAKLAKDLEDAKKPPATKEDDKDLSTKVREEQQAKEKEQANAAAIESALKFNLTVESFVEANKALLPNAIGEIIKAAEKERYDSAAEKAHAIKASILQEYFSVQANVDALTQAHKSAVEDYLKLTKKGREEKADHIYVNVFEPALETMRQVKKAQEVAAARAGISINQNNSYRDKLIAGSQKHYFGASNGT